MAKKQVDISETLITSLVIGAILTIILSILIHTQSKFSAVPSSSKGGYSTYETGVSIYWAECPFGTSHRFEGNGSESMGDIVGGKNSSAKTSTYFAAAFDGHWFLLIAGTIFIGLIIYFFKTTSVYVVKN